MNWGKWVEGKEQSLFLALVGLVLIGVGVLWWKLGSLQQDKIEILESEPSIEEGVGGGDLTIDVAGAVIKPGVYKLKSGTRIVDALEMAGGISQEADQVWMEKYLNRSERLKDGTKLYIPKRNEKISESKEEDVVMRGGKVNINTASQSELEALPGIGEVTAGKVVSGRPYGSVNELMDKKVVTNKQWEQIKELIAVW
jgi:competence protein ComEA